MTLRFQEIHQIDEKGCNHSKWMEILAGYKMLDRLNFVLKLDENLIKENELRCIDIETMDIINKHKSKIKDIKDKKWLKFVNMNLFPWTINLLINENSDIKDKLKKIKGIITSIEILENIKNPIDYINLNNNKLVKIIKTDLWLYFWLDDITMSLLQNNNDGFIMEELNNYLQPDLIDFIKIDINLTRLIITDKEKFKDFFWILFNEKKWLVWCKIIFEGVETKEELDIILTKINKHKEWIKKSNIKIYFQGYYFHKPEVISS